MGADLKAFAARFKRFLLLLTITLIQMLFVRSGTPLLAIRNIP